MAVPLAQININLPAGPVPVLNEMTEPLPPANPPIAGEDSQLFCDLLFKQFIQPFDRYFTLCHSRKC